MIQVQDKMFARHLLALVTLIVAGSRAANLESLVNRTLSQDEAPKESRGDVWNMVASMHGAHDASPGDYRHFSDRSLKFDWNLSLDHKGRYRLDWKVHYERNEIIFALNIDQNTSNFRRGRDIFALGFSQYGELESSDFCIVWFDLGHRLHLQDARTNEENILQLVDSNESICRLLAKSDEPEPSDEARGAKRRHHSARDTRITFRRPLEGPLLSLDGLNLTSFAGAPGGGQGEAGESVRSMDRFESGLKRVQLIAQRSAGGSAPTRGSNSLDIRMDNLEVPAKETTYWCKLFRLPERFESRRSHITRYEAVIEEGNEHIVHHMELFNCANMDAKQERDLAELLSNRGGWQGECGAADRPPASEACRKVIMAWAIGAQPLVYPELVGQSIGGPGYSPFVLLEVHYNNVRASAGLQDSSGLRFHYTSRLRPFDAGILEVGLEYSDKNSIPPGMVTPLVGHCPGECTRVAMAASPGAEAGIYIFAGQMHTHLAGRASWTEQVREGRLLAEIQRDDHYSAHFQEIRLLPAPVHVAPGDSLLHYCLYDTRARTRVTLGGFATSDEMCVTYLHYYPRIDLEVCKSSVDGRALAAYFDRLASRESQPTSSAAKSVGDNYRSVEWSARRADELLQFYDEAPLSLQCNRSDGRRFAGHWNGATPTRLWPDQRPRLVDYRGRRSGPAQCAAGPGAAP